MGIRKLVAHTVGLLLVVGAANGQAAPSDVVAHKRVQAEALRLRAEIEARPDVEIPIGTLLERAHGARQAEDYGEALERYYGVLRRLDRMEPADARVWAAETYWGVGITLRAQGCMLEAAMAFAEVLREWRDPAWDLLCIRGARACLRTYAKEMGIEETPEMDELLAMADGWQATSVLSRQLIPEIEPARAAYDRRDFEEALEHLRPIEHDSTYFHPAQVMIGHCLQRLGRDDAALEHWGAYVKAHQGPGSLRPTSPALDKLRRESVARATFYLGKAQHERARARFAASGGRNTAGFVAVVERLGTFGEDFPASDVIAPVVGDLLVDSYLRLGRFGEACRVHERLVRDWPGNRFTRGAGRRVVTLFGAAGFR